MKNTDRIVDYILENVKDLPASKIKALGEVVNALGGEKLEAPNTVEENLDWNLMDEEAAIDLTKVKNIVIDGKTHKVDIV